MNKWTPGPWTVVGHFVYSGDWLVADCYRHMKSNEENLANTCLIAAAPDLYEALEDVLRVADRTTVEFDAAHAALAKARGEQP